MKKLSIIFLGLFLAVLFSRIYSIDPLNELIGDFGDKYEFFNYMYLVKENIQEGKYALASTNTLRYPVGFELGHGFDGVFSTFTGALLGFIIPLPLAYNLTLILILFLNFYFAYILFLRLTSSKIFGIFAGIFYGFSPYTIARINGHTNLAFIAGYPFLTLSILNIIEKTKRKIKFSLSDFLSFFAGILLVAFGSLQYLIITFYILLFFCLVLFLIYPSDFINFIIEAVKKLRYSFIGRLPVFIFSTSLFLVIALYFFAGYARGIITGSFIYPFNYSKYINCCLPQISDLFIPNQFSGSFWSLFNMSPSSIERVITLGVVEWVLVVLFFYVEKNKLKKIIWLLFFAIYLVASLGIIPLPYWPEGGRSVVILSLITLILFAENIFFRHKSFLVVLTILLIIERLFLSVYKTVPLPFELGNIVTKQDGVAVLNIPLSGSVAYRSVLPYLFNKSIIDGYFHDTAENAATYDFFSQSLIERYFCNYEKLNPDELNFKEVDYQNTVSLLKQNDIKSIVIHKNLKYEKFYYDDCLNVRYWWYNLSPETLILDKDTKGAAKSTLQLYQYPLLKVKLYFKKGGVFHFDGLYITNNFFDDTKINLFGKYIYNPKWLTEGDGIKSEFLNKIESKVKAGDEIIIFSDKKFYENETIYLTLFYSFTPDSTLEIAPPIEKIYSSNDYEIFNLN
ncbi:hypothetical protein A2W14_01595 [Candidatus Gottesmanbacteria bacterium RBG_16_37_8]|uniref:Glycosyltransferase RgtA/B/C/D-like domain-containing protein n=1 Tax=Candidatus Gottesmanbacteria bacterium RBG_16_37_8 TaxID=1798371 RepID=A0A1F5YQJ3_9BACT|nr:MAG: hypothetical protein A2W14_01595 [Candidatus Gottesmanbacteria bacterium RBG_16_37_8]